MVTREADDAHQRMMLVLGAMRTLGVSLDLQAVLLRTAEILAHAGRARCCSLYLFDPEQDNLTRRVHYVRPDSFDECSDSFLIACLRDALAHRRPVQCVATPENSLAVPIVLGDAVFGGVVLYGRELAASDSPEQLTVIAQIAQVCAGAIRNAQIHEDVQRRLAESHSLQQVATSVLQGHDLRQILDIVCREAQRLTGASGSAVLTRDGESHLRLVHSTGQTPLSQERIPLDGSLAGLAVRRGVPILANDPASYPVVNYRDPKVMSILVAPMRVESAIIGVMDVVNKAGGFNADDVRIISQFADHAAVNIEYARLRLQAEQMAVIEERQRLARELHDSVTQSLYSVTLYANATELALAAGKTTVVMNNLRELRDTAQAAMLDMRLLIFELHPPILEKEGLVAVLQARLAAVESRAGLHTEFRAENQRRLPVNLEQELYRIAQEALNNVEKHAHARRVSVMLRYSQDAVRLEVSDDGVGFDPQASRKSGGMGLHSIAERAALAGGSLDLRSRPGTGTQVIVTVRT